MIHPTHIAWRFYRRARFRTTAMEILFGAGTAGPDDRHRSCGINCVALMERRYAGSAR